jgi:hypothetical protein
MMMDQIPPDGPDQREKDPDQPVTNQWITYFSKIYMKAAEKAILEIDLLEDSMGDIMRAINKSNETSDESTVQARFKTNPVRVVVFYVLWIRIPGLNPKTLADLENGRKALFDALVGQDYTAHFLYEAIKTAQIYTLKSEMKLLNTMSRIADYIINTGGNKHFFNDVKE